MKEFESALVVISELFIPLCLGFAVATARIGRHGWLGLAHFIRELTLSCFYGVIMFWLLDLTDYPPTVKYGITGGGVYIFIELGNVIFAKLEKMIQEFQIPMLSSWFRKDKDQ